jgi:hypothetical protein
MGSWLAILPGTNHHMSIVRVEELPPIITQSLQLSATEAD